MALYNLYKAVVSANYLSVTKKSPELLKAQMDILEKDFPFNLAKLRSSVWVALCDYGITQRGHYLTHISSVVDSWGRRQRVQIWL